MALTDDGGSNLVMPVSPMGNNGGFGFGDGNSWWIILFLFCIFGGWGGNGFGGYSGGRDGMSGLYPWMNNSNQMNNGFRDQMLNSSINGIQSAINSGFGDTALGIAGINQNVCQSTGSLVNAMNTGFAGNAAAITGAQNALTQQMYANQLADLERSFAAQTAATQGMNGLQSQLAQCCCDNRAATADLKYTVATEECTTRNNSTMNTRDIIEAQTRGTQAILDKLCALELEGVKGQLAQAQRENTGLQNQLNIATMQASQAAQTATFQQGLNSEVDALYNRLKNCPVGTYPVCNPLTSPYSNGGCSGCGM